MTVRVSTSLVHIYDFANLATYVVAYKLFTESSNKFSAAIKQSVAMSFPMRVIIIEMENLEVRMKVLVGQSVTLHMYIDRSLK